MLPSPLELLRTHRVDPRTFSALTKSIGQLHLEGEWTARQYLAIEGVGPLILLDVLVAAEVHGLCVMGLGSSLPCQLLEDEVAALDRWTTHRENLVERPSLWRFERALSLIEQTVPATAASVERVLVEAGLARGPGPFRTIERGLDLLDIVPPFTAVRLGEDDLLVPAADAAAARLAHATACRLMRRNGIINIHALASRMRSITHVLRKSELVERCLAPLSGFAWLDKGAGWCWFTNHESPLKPRLLKEILNARTINATDLRDRLFSPSESSRPTATAIEAVVATMPAIVMNPLGTFSVTGIGEPTCAPVVAGESRPVRLVASTQSGRG